jgi:hypothetical protein
MARHTPLTHAFLQPTHNKNGAIKLPDATLGIEEMQL